MRLKNLITVSAALLPLAFPVAQAAAQDEGPATVHVIVRAESKSQAVTQLQPANLKLEFNGKKVDIANVLLRQGGGRPVEVALLIDDGLRANFGTQLQEVEQFVTKTASPQIALGIGYMRNGRAEFPVGFSTQPEQELKAVRLPISAAGIDGSPYFCLDDLVKHWPTGNTGAAHIVLMITNGIDRYNGSVSPMNQDSPYVQEAIDNAQKAGVPVYSIYYGRREVNSNLGSFSGQSYLAQVADGTGGETFAQGTINPVTLAPYFNQFNRALQESYLVSFQTGSRKLERLKVSSTVSGLKVHAPQAASAGSQ